jgi:hypothetical protein
MKVEVGDGVACVAVGDTMVELWKAPASLPRWRWFEAQRDGLLARHEQLIVFTLILASSSPPDGTVRAAMQDSFRKLGPKMRRMVVVPLGNSVWQSVVRTIVRGVLIVSGAAKQQVVANNVTDGIARVLEVAGPSTPDRRQLRAAADALASALGHGPLEEGAEAPRD